VNDNSVKLMDIPIVEEKQAKLKNKFREITSEIRNEFSFLNNFKF